MTDILPGDIVTHNATGIDAWVSTSHCSDSDGCQLARLIAEGAPFHGEWVRADALTLKHRHDFQPYHGIRRCACGEVYTTMADTMVPRGHRTLN